jgi:hypothetical protein
MKPLQLVFTAFLASVAGCTVPAVGGGSSGATPAVQTAVTDSAVVRSPVVQVRSFWRSAVVSVVAWEADDAEVGLRTSVSRTGELVGGRRIGDHSLYMSPLYARSMGGFKYASDTLGHLLLGIGARRDLYACYYGKDCLSMTTVGVRVPDSLLRANRDSLVLRFYPQVLEPWTITLRRELIAAYLKTVDSVVAEMKTTRAM